MQSTAQARHASRVDTVCHSGVQPWSAGPIFPAVIAKVERYIVACTPAGDAVINAMPLERRLETQWYELTLDGRTEQYATREDAEMVAKALLESPRLRARWSHRELQRMDDCVCGTQDAAEHEAGSVREHALYLAACERSVREGVAA